MVDATGQVLGKTPFAYTHTRGSQIEILSLRKEGFSDQRLPVDCSRDGEAAVTLVAVPGGQAAKPDPSGDPKGGSVGTDSSKASSESGAETGKGKDKRKEARQEQEEQSQQEVEEEVAPRGPRTAPQEHDDKQREHSRPGVVESAPGPC